MCAVSNIGSGWQQANPQINPGSISNLGFVSRFEFDALKAEIEALKLLLIKAKKVDEASGTPDCEEKDKVKLLKAVAKAVGVDLSEVFK